MPDSVPRRLAIYYGIPSLVNGAGGNPARAAAAFSPYDAVVFGDGLEFDDVVASRKPPGPGAVEHRKTTAIARLLAASPRATRVFGYVDLGRTQQLSLDEIRVRVERWKATGASGIFYDEAGADYGVDRARQNAGIDVAHAAGLRAVLNAFEPDDVFTASSGVRTHLAAGDAYLLESFAVRNGEAASDAFSRGRVDRAVRGARETGVSLWASTTTATGAFDVGLMRQAWDAAVSAGVEAFAWGEPSFGSADSVLPFRPRPR